MKNAIQEYENSAKKDKLPEFKSGDTVTISVKIKEGEKERIQIYTGTVIQRHGSGLGETFTVRKISGGVAVERVFPLHSPIISKIKVDRHGLIRQSRIYYLRDRIGKKARIKEKITKR
jgi:large subunit ribosomal protein L19